ncbi:MFS transporter [Candidatus Tisiphia endosymbiont of Thecophora atra]|uniref:MFS transporter n=1 Tax=Candidatus Tisiphia endosymbiont of Thecophora atra TaxID=3066258 RepID=UPI00312C7EF8
MVGYQQEQRSLTKEQKEAVGLLSIGTFLEYFDLMLYVHMAVLLNELFFQSSNSLTASLNTALAFCSTYVLRPLGALIFGWIGDNIGRKVTVVVTTTMMSISCVVMATLPTYAEIGITASILVTICRMVQGMSSMGEVIGAEIYVTEITKPPVQYPAVSMITIFSSLGGFAALGVASLAIKQNFNWRYAFWVGAGIALVGSIARTKLRETPDFANAKSRVKNIIKKAGFNHDSIESNPIVQEKVKIKSSISLFLIQCAWPVCFYFIYFHCSNILKSSFGYSGEQIVDHNFIISIVQVLSFIIWTYLSCYIYPLILLKVKLIIFSIIVLIFPYLLNNLNSPSDLLILQLVTIMFSLSYSSAMPIFYKHFPVFKRFTYASFLYALSRAFIYVITSFGLVYLTNYFGNYGILIVIVPTILGFAFGLNHFGNLEKEVGNYPQKDLN